MASSLVIAVPRLIQTRPCTWVKEWGFLLPLSFGSAMAELSDLYGGKSKEGKTSPERTSKECQVLQSNIARHEIVPERTYLAAESL